MPHLASIGTLGRALVLAGATILAAAACASPTSSPTASASAGPTEPTGSASVGVTESPVDESIEPGASDGEAGPFDPARFKLGLRRVAAGFDQPVAVRSAGDSSGRLFVVEQPGRIKIVLDGKVLAQPFLDIHSKVSCCAEQGLLGLAFAPGFGADGGRVYVDYTDSKGDTAVAVLTVDASAPNVADPASLRVVLRVKQPFANHNGGDIAFGPDGFLYVALGDGGSGGDPQGNGQRLNALLGKLLRIDVAGDVPEGATYSIPSDNPFVDKSSARPEIWAYGLRNPWRFSFDRQTGDLWIGDVGQGSYEEIDRALIGDGRGADYGWNAMEGFHCFGDEHCDNPEYVLPITEVDHSAGDCAIIGGYVYRGEAYPTLTGGYVFSDECSGTIRSLVADGPDKQDPVTLLDTDHVVSSFGEDDGGEIYLTDLASGELFQVTAAPR